MRWRLWHRGDGSGGSPKSEPPQVSEPPVPNGHVVQRSNLSKGHFDEAYSMEELLGSGSFAVVHQCRHVRSDVLRAVKLISKCDEDGDEHDSLQVLDKEIEIFHRVGSHPNILEVFDAYETDEQVWIVLELAKGGMLLDRLESFGSFSEADAALVTQQLLGALAFLHQHGIVHGDIKLDNVLLASADCSFREACRLWAVGDVCRLRAVRATRGLPRESGP